MGYIEGMETSPAAPIHWPLKELQGFLRGAFGEHASVPCLVKIFPRAGYLESSGLIDIRDASSSMKPAK